MSDEFTREQLGKCASRGAAWLSGRLAAFALKQGEELEQYKDVRQELLHRAEKAELEAAQKLWPSEMFKQAECTRTQHDAARAVVEAARETTHGHWGNRWAKSKGIPIDDECALCDALRAYDRAVKDGEGE